jgi:catechol 2,3-dioxygenase-like lactoylglutathione lyase family enzyme
MIVIEKLNYIGLTVSNLEESISFYKEFFDFDVVDKISGSDQAFLKMGDLLISLSEVEGYKNQEGTKNTISFFVDEEDFDDALDEIEENEIRIVYGPENLRNGRAVVFLDPDDNQIELSYPGFV